MPTIRIITDSACDLDWEMIQQAGIEIISLHVTFGAETYKDMMEITRERFYEMLARAKELPRTSQPSPSDYVEIYQKDLAEADELLVLTLSSGLSGTYNAASLARGMLQAEQQERVWVFDTKAASVGQGLLALEAARRVKAGETTAEIVKALESFRDRLASVFTLDTLVYLEKGGRISKVQAMVGTILNVKPILQLDEAGRIVPREKVRGRKQALQRLLDIMAAEGDHLEDQVIGICHARAAQEAEETAAEIRRRFRVRDVVIGEISAIIGTHVGPGCFAVFYQRKA